MNCFAISRFTSCVTPALLCLALTGLSLATQAQNTTYADDHWLNWQETEITTFPAFNPPKTIPVEINVHSQVQWSIDPDTITIGKDSVVRYVILATSQGGTINAMYEGILCAQDTYKTYARAIGNSAQSASSIEWRALDNPQWNKLADAQAFSHERVLARNYMCDGSASPSSVNAIIAKIRNPFGTVRK